MEADLPAADSMGEGLAAADMAAAGTASAVFDRCFDIKRKMRGTEGGNVHGPGLDAPRPMTEPQHLSSSTLEPGSEDATEVPSRVRNRLM